MIHLYARRIGVVISILLTLIALLVAMGLAG